MRLWGLAGSIRGRSSLGDPANAAGERPPTGRHIARSTAADDLQRIIALVERRRAERLRAGQPVDDLDQLLAKLHLGLRWALPQTSQAC